MAGALVPRPRRVLSGGGWLRLDDASSIAVTGERSARLLAVARRLADRLTRPTGLRLPVADGDSQATITIAAGAAERGYPTLGGDESHRLLITERTARIEAETPPGASQAIETLLQLLEQGPDGYRVPVVDIEDAPRFPWRGLLLDVCRHWMPLDAVLRTIDMMAAVKLNVLHLHLTEDQAFRFECLTYPRLHELGSEGSYFTQAELRAIVEHAADRAVRVVPEIDVPGHTTSWLVGYPELAATRGPFSLRREFGISNAALDPANEHVYELLDAVVGELAGVFPDEFIHTGGDEVDPSAWPNVADARVAQAAFTRRLADIVATYGRRMVVWDEALSPELPEDVVVQAWRGPGVLHDAVRAGHPTVLSAGWYLDHLFAARHLYAVDPLAPPAEVATAQLEVENDPSVVAIRPILRRAHQLQRGPTGLEALPPEAEPRVLGGEACLWSELVTSFNLDQRIWPRTAAVAERLWSPRSDDGADGLDARLICLGTWLERSVGSTHRLSRDEMLESMAAARAGELRTLSDALEPVKWYARLFSDIPFPLTQDPPDRSGLDRHYTTGIPLDRLVDATPPESATAYRLARLVPSAIADPEGTAADELAMIAESWRAQRAELAPLTDPRVSEVALLSADLAECAALVEECVAALREGSPITKRARAHYEQVLDRATAPCAELVFVVGAPLRRLLELSAG
ncbi:MAG: beta-N-acetylhexosaminidase, partial [Acidimicrobiia bacterium]